MMRTGIDLVAVARIRDAIAAHGDRFVHRVFTAGEIAYCAARRDPYPHYAARFALKEALFKALPAGTLGALVWNEIGVENSAEGAPALVLSGATAARLREWQFTISLSHTHEMAVAHVIATPPAANRAL